MPISLNLPPEWNGFPLPVHPVMEAVAYFAGYRLFRYRSRTEADPLPPARRLAILIAAGFGALLGSKLPGVWTWYALSASTASGALEAGQALSGPLGGKTLVGGILFAWLAVEAAKRLQGIRVTTGDAFIIPLIFAMIIGRLGCFLAGVEDGTQGLPSSLPWAIDYGDGTARHPAPLYEIAFLGALWLGIWKARDRWAPGGRFKAFILAYMGFRLAVDFLKPDPDVALGLSSVQWTALAALALLSWHVRRYGGPWKKPGPEQPSSSALTAAPAGASASPLHTARNSQE